MSRSLRLSLCTVLYSMPVHAVEVNHLIQEYDSMHSQLSAGVCRGIENGTTRTLCLADRDVIKAGGGLSADLLLKLDQAAIGPLIKVSQKKVDQDVMDDLFTEIGFMDSSGLVRFQVAWNNVSFSYVPLHAFGAYRLSNPALPELDVAAVRQSSLRLSQRQIFSLPSDSIFRGELVLSYGLAHYERQYTNIQTDILSASGGGFRNQIKTENSTGLNGDVSLSYFNYQPWLPSIVFNIDRIGESIECQSCETAELSVRSMLEPESSVIVTTFFNLAIGRVLGGVRLPFYGYYEDLQLNRGVALLSYHLSHLSIASHFSPTSYGLGFLFSHGHYQIGIRYANEKQDNRLTSQRKQQTYLFASYQI